MIRKLEHADSSPLSKQRPGISAWDELPSEIFENSFTGSGYVYEEGADYSCDTDSD